MYTVRVKPGSSKGPLVEKVTLPDNSEELIVYLRAKAVDGAANKQLIEVLSKYFSVAKSRINIKIGTASRVKFIEVRDK